MCTVVVLIRPAPVGPGHTPAWPYPPGHVPSGHVPSGHVPSGHIVLAANRDERIDRAWDPPGHWWPDRPEVIAGRDRTAGGTWMGMNRHGVVAAVLNRPGTLGPAAGKRSRGELPLLALDHATAGSAAMAISQLDAGAWRGFNMVIADRSGAWFVRGLGAGTPEAEALAPGVSMITAHDPNDLDSPRTAQHLPRFRAAEPADPLDWSGWRAILADRHGSPAQQINVVPRAGFGTVCSSYVVLGPGDPLWLFAAGPPHINDFRPVFCGGTSTAISPAPPQAVTT